MQGSRARSRLGDADRGVEDVRRNGHFAHYRRRAARIRRKSRAGSQGEMAGIDLGLPGDRVASDRAAAIQQGEGGGGAVRRHPFGRPSEHLRSVSQGNQLAEQAAGIVRPAEHWRGATKGRRRARRRRCVHRKLPRKIWSRHFRPDVHPAGRPGAGAAFCADRQDRRAQRPAKPVDGHERRFRHRDPVRRHACARGLGDFRDVGRSSSLRTQRTQGPIRRSFSIYNGCSTAFAQ